MGRGGGGAELAPAYALALDLEASGVSASELAEVLGVPAQAVPALLAMAHAKAESPANRRIELEGP